MKIGKKTRELANFMDSIILLSCLVMQIYYAFALNAQMFLLAIAAGGVWCISVNVNKILEKIEGEE